MGTIKVYLSALQHKQVALGFPGPQHSTMPKLKLIINGQNQSSQPREHIRYISLSLLLSSIKSNRYGPKTVLTWT